MTALTNKMGEASIAIIARVDKLVSCWLHWVLSSTPILFHPLNPLFFKPSHTTVYSRPPFFPILSSLFPCVWIDIDFTHGSFAEIFVS